MEAGDLIDWSPVCSAAVTGATGATTVKVGSLAVARTGAGVYTTTLSQPVNAGQMVAVITMRTSGTYNYLHTSDIVKTINTFAVDGVTATDKNFDLVIIAFPPGQ